MEQAPTIAALPATPHWQTPPERWSLEADGTLRITAGARTDLFADPAGDAPDPGMRAAPALVGELSGDFQLSAQVDVEVATTFDAGVLLLWAGERTWAKLCLELSPQHQPTVVSVVTREVSDDCNSFTVDGGPGAPGTAPSTARVGLRIARLGGTFAFHASTDGETWRMIRYFSLGVEPDQPVSAGFLAQSPTGDGCTATFSAISYTAERLAELRDGS